VTMHRFTRLFCELDRTTRTTEKVSAMESYFRETPPADAAWALQFLAGRIPARVVSTRNLWNWTIAETSLPHWLLEECQDAVGDLGETLALVFPITGKGTRLSLSEIVEQRFLPLRHLSEVARRDLLVATWRELNAEERLVWNKLITGAFRIGVARTLVIRALANVAEIPPAVMAHRVMGAWQPTAEDFQRLLSGEVQATESARPYPFFLASPIEVKLKDGSTLSDILGKIDDWLVEWKWDGIRAQLIRRSDETMIWSRGDEMVTDSSPEIAEAGGLLPDGTVLDGEILAWRDERVLPFAQLQRRLGRKQVTDSVRSEFPVAFLCYDLLEYGGIDIRDQPLTLRRSNLEKLLTEIKQSAAVLTGKPGDRQEMLALFASPGDSTASEFPFRLSPIVQGASWDEVAAIQHRAREQGTEGLMLKRKSSPYRVGRQRGDWWKWKIDPYVMDAVLIYAQRGQGRRASLYTDYTFGVWDSGELIPVAKAYSGLTDEEIQQVDTFVRHNTLEKHGPVRFVKPVLVFELAFEGIQQSTRHRGGLAVRFPRMSRWRQDKKPEEADTLSNLRALVESHAGRY
jgi:DNA ligase-1